MGSRYRKMRKEFEADILEATLVESALTRVESPTRQFRLKITSYSWGPNVLGWTRGVVTDTESGEIIADVKRNHSAFWHCWVGHPNGNEYLLCGEDYQGYQVINLTKRLIHVHFPDAGFKGQGFCWTAVVPSPDKLVLAVDGCYWACDYDLVFYDFRTPDSLPLKELTRVPSVTETRGWKDNESFMLSQALEIRRSDSALYESLDAAEQKRLDDDPSLLDVILRSSEVKRPPFVS